MFVYRAAPGKPWDFLDPDLDFPNDFGIHWLVNLQPDQPLVALLRVGPYIFPRLPAVYQPNPMTELFPESPVPGLRRAQAQITVELNDMEPLWWFTTAVILILDEALLRGVDSQDHMIRDLLLELRTLRDLIIWTTGQPYSHITIPDVPMYDDSLPECPTFYSRPAHAIAMFTQAQAIRLLKRRYNYTVACRITRSISSLDRLGNLLSEAATICSEPMGPMPLAEYEKFRAVTDRIRALSVAIDFARILHCHPMSGEIELLRTVVNGGCPSPYHHDLTIGPLPDMPVAEGAFGQVFKVRSRFWGFLAVKLERVGHGKGQNELVSITLIPPHLNILPMFGFCGDRLALIMPWAKNGTLEKYLEENPEAKRLLLLQQVASALAHMHSLTEPMVHGDIHMGNVLVSNEGDALLCDFGLSRVLDDPSAVGPNNTTNMAEDPETGGATGVMVYIAPERHDGWPRSRETDVFAFGMLCFQVYSGRMPLHELPTALAVILALTEGKRPLRSEVSREDFTDDMWQLVQQCWSSDPKQRPTMASIHQLLCNMDTADDKQTREEKGIRTEFKFFRADNRHFTEHIQHQEQHKKLRKCMSLMEKRGLTRALIELVARGQSDFTPFQGHLEAAKKLEERLHVQLPMW